MPDSGKESPNFTVLPLAQFHDEMRFLRGYFAPRDSVGAEAIDARHERLCLGFSHLAADGHQINARDAVHGVRDAIGERGVGCEEQQPARGEIQPPDGHEAARFFASDEVEYRSPPLRVSTRRHHPARLVEEDRPPRHSRLPGIVEGDANPLWNDRRHRIAHDAAVHPNATGEDRLTRAGPRQNAEFR